MTKRAAPPGLGLAGKRVLVLGLGQTGRELAKLAASHGARVLASETGEARDEDVAALRSAGIDVEVGGHDRARKGLASFDLVLPSPGISPLRGLLAEAIDRGFEIASELDLGMRMTNAPVIAVTGTNGKTTVCRLAERIGRAAGLDVHACGNLETKFVTSIADHPGADAFVVEASSFSLAFVKEFHPRVAVVTSLAPDHLDWHGTFEHYRDSKARIAARQTERDLYLFPLEQPELASLPPDGGPRRVPFAGIPLEESEAACASGDEIVVRIADRVLRARGARAFVERGRHFAADAAAAVAAMTYLDLGVETSAVEEGLRGFTFDRHRLEGVGSLRGVRFVDDSVATNMHATAAALRSFDDPVVLIAGGRNKGIDLSPLADHAGSLRAVVAIGEAAEEVAHAMRRAGMFVEIVGSMREAVAMAIEVAHEGDVVLLSPACASHDMFANYAERGDAFVEACRDAGVQP